MSKAVSQSARDYTARMVERVVSLDAIEPHPENPRQHPQSQILQLKASHEQLGQFEPVILWQRPQGYIQVKGHGYDEGVKLTQDETVKAWILPEDTPPHVVKQIMLASNLHAMNSHDDETVLARLLQEQQDLGIDLASLGTDGETLRQMLESLGNDYLQGEQEDGAGGDDYEVNPDEVEVRCKRGELWQLGKHRLLVDDSTKVENVEKLMQGERASLMATDPPYGVSWVEKANDMQQHGYGHSRAVLHGSIESDDLNNSDLKAFLKTFLESAKCAGDSPMPFYLWHAERTQIIFKQALTESGYFIHQPVLWIKSGFVIGRQSYHSRFEAALHGWRQGNGKCPFYGERNQSDVWEVARENDKIHPTQKPLQLFDTPILNHTKEGEICYEPFAGSGTQIISAERLKRRCYAMELDEKYATVILNRWEAETGQTAHMLERVEVAHV